MNPNQLPGPQTPGGTSLPPTPPTYGPVSDIPEEGFGFTDEAPVTQLAQSPVVQPAPLPQPIAPRPAPQLTPPQRPVLQPLSSTPAAPRPAPAVVPVAQQVAPQPIVQQPQQVAPTPIIPPVPAAMMPPQQIPAVPQPQVVPTQAASIAPTPQPTQPTAPEQDQPFNPAQVPVHASSTSENPVTATFTPQPSGNHLPSDIAQRINEKPMQNSGDILRQVKHGLNGSRLKSILSFIIFTASIFVAAFMINQFVFQSYYVEGTSMTPTLQNNDRLIISKVERTIAGVQGHPYIPERGQIVVLDSSIIGLNGQHEQLIKRVIGVPGDQIHIEAGVVTIKNAQHPDGFDVTRDLGLTNLLPTYVDTPIDVAIPDGQVYVMGDNREQGGSYDSRSFGPIDGNQIQGRLWGRVLPLESARLY